MKTVVYTSDKRTHFFKELKEMYHDIRKSNFLAFQIAKRNIQAQYRQSLLGFFWAFAPVIANSLVWIFLKKSGTINISEPQVPYALFVVIGTMLWSVFLECLQNPIAAINSGASIISKINFPKEALLISSLYKTIFNLIIKLILIAILLAFFGIMPTHTIVYFPIYLGAIMLLAFSIGIFIAPIGLLYPDINKIIGMASGFAMYVTPIVYMAPQTGFFKNIFEINPLTHLINGTRNSLTGFEVQHLTYVLALAFLSLILLVVGLVIFRKSMPIIIEKVS